MYGVLDDPLLGVVVRTESEVVHGDGDPAAQEQECLQEGTIADRRVHDDQTGHMGARLHAIKDRLEQFRRDVHAHLLVALSAPNLRKETVLNVRFVTAPLAPGAHRVYLWYTLIRGVVQVARLCSWGPDGRTPV